VEKLPELPKAIRILKPIEAEMLNSTDAGRRWRSPKECLVCGATKTFRWYSPKQPTEVVDWECNCADQWIMYRYFLAHGIPIRYQKLGWRDTHAVNSASLRSIVEYVQQAEDHIANGTGLYLYGPNGTGKTMIGSLVLKIMMSRGYSGYMTTFIDLIEGKKAGFDDAEAKEWFVRQVRNSDFLLIDDPGKEQTSGERQIGFQTSLLDEVVRYRSGMQLPTIITANYSTDVFRQRYGESISSLLAEGQVPVAFYGQDYRKEFDDLQVEIKNKGLSRPMIIQ